MIPQMVACAFVRYYYIFVLVLRLEVTRGAQLSLAQENSGQASYFYRRSSFCFLHFDFLLLFLTYTKRGGEVDTVSRHKIEFRAMLLFYFFSLLEALEEKEGEKKKKKNSLINQVRKGEEAKRRSGEKKGTKTN